MHPLPPCPLCNTHLHYTHHLFNCIHIRTTLTPLDLWTPPVGVTALLARWTDNLAGGEQAGISDSPLLTRVMGVVRQKLSGPIGVCNYYARRQVSQGSCCRDSLTHASIPPNYDIYPDNIYGEQHLVIN